MRPVCGFLVRMRKSITQREIARRLGVSQALVSRALGGTHADIQASPETARRIRAAAARWEYRPSAVAQTLRGAPTRVLGVVVKRFEDPYFGLLVSELERLASAGRYSLVLAGAAAGLEGLARHRPEGIILVGSDFEPDGLEDWLAQPVVRIGEGGGTRGLASVAMDEVAGLTMLARHFAELGHRACGFVGDRSPTNTRRAAILREALTNAGMATPKAFWVSLPASGSDVGYHAMRRWLDTAGSRPTAVVAAEDVHALGALRATHERAVRVPSELSVAGIDDMPFARLSVPALTTVRQPVEAMAQAAFAIATGAADAAVPMRLSPELVVRESTAAPHKDIPNAT